MKQNEIVRFTEGVEMRHRAYDGDGRLLLDAEVHEQTLKTARRTVYYAFPRTHEVDRIVAKLAHLLRNRQILALQTHENVALEDLGLVQVKPRLDGGKRRIRVLRCRPAIFKDDALGEEAHDVRDVLVAVDPLRRPRQSVR